MDSRKNIVAFYKNRRILVTGHTGFKGAWLTCVLNSIGASSTGYALEPVEGCLYDNIDGNKIINSFSGRLEDYDNLLNVMIEVQPEIIIHLAAFGFMKECYDNPFRAYSSNVMGTVNLLEAVRECDSVKSVVLVSTDKVYANKGDGAIYDEKSPLGGNSPYSCSKTCMEYVIQDYIDTYFSKMDRKIGIGVVRASNVLAGGDHIKSRLIPSILNALDGGTKVEIRNPDQTRPWQSVLDALDGYLTVAKYLYESEKSVFGVWNIGPKFEGIKSVAWIFQKMQSYFDLLEGEEGKSFNVNESATLGLDISKMADELGWKPRLSVDRTVEMVVDFYKGQKSGIPERELCFNQIKEYYNL